jgi:hypothetical protein
MSISRASVRAQVGSVAADSSSRPAARRRAAGVVNRRLGWVCVPLVLAAFVLRWIVEPLGIDSGNAIVLLRIVFTPLVFVHVGLSVYVYGWVPWQRTVRVLHIWIGYLYLACMFAAQTTFGHPAHDVLTVAMVTSLAIHVGMGVHFARRRRSVTVSVRG